MYFYLILTLLFLYNPAVLEAKESLSLDSAIRQALDNNPEIKAAQAIFLASAKRPTQVSSLPNPTIGLRFKNVSFSEITLGEDPRTDVQAYFIQDIPFPTKLSSKRKIAEQISESQKWKAESVTRKVIAELKKEYYNWYLINKSLDITKRNKELLEQFVKTAEIKYEVGKGIQQDVIKAQVELSSFIHTVEHLKMKKEITEARIRKILNLSQHVDIGSPEKIEKTDINITMDKLSEMTKNQSPQLLEELQLVESSQEQLQLAKKQYLPDFVIQGTYYNRDGGTDNFEDLWQVGLGLKVPLYFWRKEKPAIQEAHLNLQASKDRYDDSTAEILFEIKDKYISANTADRLMGLYKDGIIPQSQISLESAISGYQVGDVDFLTLLNNLITLFNFEIEYYKQLAEHEISVAMLEQISGVDFNKIGSGNPGRN
ncbi:MAG: TolC family protein [Candidatus Dadabacteria bacterium]|nr:TolC family protein [Candidatus Dadabacteria bacterium]NIX14817.1 TolC family protein [Candidatus Dadabacteria bacterium]